MLAELTVKNFALIEELQLSFGPGLNVLTGETGAGKSILVGAINLILGGRASSDLIREGSEEAEVQALFVLPEGSALPGRLEELGLPAADEVIIRRVMPRSGRNRIYVNGALATLVQLTALGPELVAVAGQHEHQKLLDPEWQLLFLDQFGGLMEKRAEMGRLYEKWTGLKAEVSRLEKKIREGRDKAELLQFQTREIEAAALTPGEDDELEQERSRVRNAEKIYSLIRASFDRLYGESGSVLELLDAVRGDMGRASGLDSGLAATGKQIEGAYLELEDTAHFLRDYLEGLVFDPVRLEEIENRLALIGRLKRKYGPTLDDVLIHGQSGTEQLSQLDELEYQVERRRGAAAAAEKRTLETAEELGRLRREAARNMAGVVSVELRSLGMPNLEFGAAVESDEGAGGLTPHGRDGVGFMISPNLGESLKPLARIASGGELSRVMLGLKSLLAGQERVSSIIFDEVDAGIGGAVAEVVGRKIRSLADFHQVVCITHLPQIAAFGQHHHVVFKAVRGGRTVTDIRPLDETEKADEIARMIGGIEPSARTLAAAREMIDRATGREPV